MNNSATILFSFIGGVVVGGMTVSLWLHGPQQSFATNLPPAEPTASSTLPADVSGSVTVEDQPAGEGVVVAAVTVPPPGVWVAVREVTNNEVGNVLGAAYAHGPMSNLAVPLLRATLPSHEYALALFRDDGDGKFELHRDSVYVDFDTGLPVLAPFRTTP